MDLGYVALSAARRVDFVGDFGASRVGEMVGLVCVRRVVGTSVDDESGAGLAAAIPTWLDGISRAWGRELAVEACGAGSWLGDFVLLAVDRAQLRRVSSVHSGALEFAV